MKEILENNVLFLLGAGCSNDANIPISYKMVNLVEDLILEDSNWKNYKDLYNYLKSSIIYSENIAGNFNEKFNIEKLLIVVGELEKREKNLVYPFVGTWNNRLLELGGYRFENISKFKQLIIKRLYKWILPENYNDAEYYSGFNFFQSQVGKPMRVFTLNYDLCFEEVVGSSSKVMDGFDNSTGTWHFSNFEEIEDNFCLYKLHGSIDWKLDKDGKIVKIKHPGESNKAELIFGVEAKLRSKDPYLFYIYQFRKFMIEPEFACRLLVAIGYSFYDEHINDIIVQSIRQDSKRNILIVCPFCGLSDGNKVTIAEEGYRQKIAKQLGLNEKEQQQLKFINSGAREFLNTKLKVDPILEYIQIDKDDNPFDE